MEFSQVVYNDYISFSEQFADVPSGVSNCPVFGLLHVPHHSFFPSCTKNHITSLNTISSNEQTDLKFPQCHLRLATPRGLPGSRSCPLPRRWVGTFLLRVFLILLSFVCPPTLDTSLFTGPLLPFVHWRLPNHCHQSRSSNLLRQQLSRYNL